MKKHMRYIKTRHISAENVLYPVVEKIHKSQVDSVPGPSGNGRGISWSRYGYPHGFLFNLTGSKLKSTTFNRLIAHRKTLY